ncbi:hypothetical protein [Lacrimispora algidixylanolytica]|uniref:Rad50/SbcC-type AAA domain-containing protein n=1 Tax=Lacrimispora algidixylanolytica TaxID=94868 RepID=A0A419SZV7_9FIRM|nr:hypothetical protein [Lacrimispora algidixylanolytica]RKD30820.1 hypothetical protein BET01_05760 [Lacrimispora algidixylanolytica]
MFNIEKLTLISTDEQTFTYEFNEGLNYIKGKNSSGKTEFYKFLDFMFGSSYDLSECPWYHGTLKKGIMKFTYNNLTYRITRTMKTSVNYFSYFDEEDKEPISLSEYRDRLEAVFAIDKDNLRRLHDFADENITYRTFTVFSFLGEIRQGNLIDFFDKCSDLKYSIKMTSILNFIFNRNTEKLFKLKKELEKLKKDISGLESISVKNNLNRQKINMNLPKLNLNIVYNGNNKEEISNKIFEMKNMINSKNPIESQPISELEVIYNNIDDQIKIYDYRKAEMKTIQHENENRKVLLNNLHGIIAEREDFNYLIEPLISLVDELKNSITFNKYVISDETVKKLRQQRDKVKEEILRSNNKYIRFQLDEKAKVIAIIEDCIASDIEEFDNDELDSMKKRANELRNDIKNLSNADDEKKIKKISDFITSLYKSAIGVSDIIEQDFKDETFNIKYFKRGNSLKTMNIKKGRDHNGKEINIDAIQPTGSLARHTLIQLSGYLAFLELLIREEKYPIIPILVLDHISKPFDIDNPGAIGKIIENAYKIIKKKNLQIFIFDDEFYEKLGIIPDHYEELVEKNKSGFNPFFHQ